MRKGLLLFISVLIFVVIPDVAVSCPVCFGDKASAEVEGAKWAILFLLGITGTVLGGVVTFALYLRKRARLNFAETDPNYLNREL